MPKNKTIKFFISSTFKDFENERNILQKFVFPKLKDLCHKNGFGFQPIDLRWGIEEEAGLDQQTMNICLNEIKRSSYEPKPNLLLLVGQRYGWIPLPFEIKKQEFDRIIKYNKSKDKSGLKLINYPIETQLLNDWYEIDTNSKETVYYLKDKHHLTRNQWNTIEKQLRKILQETVDKSYSDDFYKKVHTSATEQEMYLGLDAFDKNKNHEHTFAYFRTIENYDSNNEVLNFIDKDLTKLEILSKKLQEDSNIPSKNQIKQTTKWNEILEAKKISYEDLTLENIPKYLKKFYDDILEKFTNSIQKEIDEFKEQTQLQIELEQQENFLNEKSEIVLGRDNEVRRILDFIKNDSKQFYLQYGKSGSGKTSVMAKAIKDLKDKNSEVDVYYRFIGTTANSTYSRQVFENLYWEIESHLQNKDDIAKPQFEIEEREFKKQLNKQLKRLQNKTVIFLDALDQFEDYNDLTILLDNLPENIKIVFSTLYDEDKKDKQDYSLYFSRLNYLENKYELLPLEQNTNKQILKSWLESKNRELTKTQWQFINPFIQDITPLHLRLIFEIVKHWKSKQKDLLLEVTQEKLITQFFNFIQKQYHHKEDLLKETLGLISASKDGLSEEELIDLFSNNENFLSLFQNYRYPKLNRLPNSIWSRFYYYIEPFFTEKLIDNEMLIKPYHRIIEEVIKDIYYKDNFLEFHIKLSSYFYNHQDKEKVWGGRYYSLRMLSELPFQLFNSKNSLQLKEILFDLEFAGSIYNNHKQEGFRDIMSKATILPNITEDEIYPWESFYREKEHLILRIDEESWKPYQSLFQLAYEDGLNSPLTKNSKLVLENNNVNWYWLKSMYIRDSYYRSGLKEWFSIEESYIPYEVKNIILLENNDLIITMKDFNHDGYKEKHNFFYRESETKRISQIDREKISSYKTKIVKQNNLYSCKKVFDSFLYKISVEDDELIIYDKLLKKYKFISIAGYRINGFKVLSKNLLMITFSGLYFGIFDIFCINDVEYINDHFILDKFFKYKNYLLGLQNKNLVLFDINEENIVFKYNIEKYNIENLLLVNDYIVIFWTATNIYMLDITSTKLELIYNLEIKIKDFLTVKFNNILFWLDNDDLLYLDIKKLSFKKIEVPIDRFYDIVDGKYLIEKVKISNDEYIKWDLSCNYFSYLYENKIYDFSVTYGDPNSFDYFEILFKTGEEIKIKKETNKGYISFYGMKKYENQSIEKIDFSFSDFSIKYRKDSLNKKFKQFFKFDNNISTLAISGTFSYKNEILNWSTDNKSYISTSYNDFQNTLEINDDIKFIINENKIDVETKNKKIIQEQLESINIKFNNKEQLDLIHDFKENIICKQALIFNFLFIPMLEIKDDILFVFFEEKVKPYKMYFGNKDISTNNIIIKEIDNHNSKIKSHNEII